MVPNWNGSTMPVIVWKYLTDPLWESFRVEIKPFPSLFRRILHRYTSMVYYFGFKCFLLHLICRIAQFSSGSFLKKLYNETTDQSCRLFQTRKTPIPRSSNPARKRSVPDNFGDFMEAVFRWTDPVTGFTRFRPELTGSCQNRQPDTVIGFLRRIPGILRRVPAGNGVFPGGFSRKFTEYCFRNHRPG